MKLERLLTPKRTVTILVVIAIVIVSAVFVHRLLGADQLKEDLMGSWYQTGEYNCAVIEISEYDSQIANKNYWVEYQHDIIEANSKNGYKIKFVNTDTVKIKDRINENETVKHTIQFNENKNVFTISPAIGNDDPETSESWYKGQPNKELLTEIRNNNAELQAQREAESIAREEEQMKNEIEITEFIYRLTDYDRLDVYGTVTNNSNHAVKHIRINIDIIGKDVIELELPEDDAILYPGESVKFDERHVGNKWVNSDDKCEIELIDYVIVD